MGSVAGFTLASFFCGFAPNLPLLIVFRVIQGATGGGLQPLSQAILLEVFPPEDRGKAMAFWALGIVVAPMLGPVLGGWLTDSYSWRWVFYINVPIGIIALLMTHTFVFDPPYIKRRAGGVDYWGMGMLVVGIGCLQVMLDKGQEEDWFSSHFILTLAVLAGVGLIGFVWRELNTDHPVVDLRVFRYRTYSAGVFLMTVLGFVLYGSTVLVPLMLQTLLGYPAVRAGIVMLPRGLGSFLAMPLVGFLMSKIEPRRLLGSGIIIASLSFWKFSHLSLDAGYWDFFIPLIVQGSAMGLLFVPLTTITNDPIPKEEIGNATSLFNLMRNIGASIGIASVTTLLSRNQQKHINILGSHVTVFDPQAQSMVDAMKAAFMRAGSDPATALQQAYAAIGGIVDRQAYMLAFNDAFRFMMIMFALMLPLIFVMKKPQHKGGAVAAH